MASSFTVALLAAALLLLPASPAADAAAAKAVRGSTVFFSFYSNTLLIKSPTGRTTAKVQLASTKRVPPGIRLTSGPATNMRRTFVLPGALSADSKFAFNPANTNTPADTDVTNDQPQIIVTDLAAGKLAATVAVPPPGAQGCNFFSASVVAHGGTPAVGFDNRLVTAGDAANGGYPLWLVLQCPEATILAKYTYRIASNKLTFSSTKYNLDSTFIAGFTPLAFVYASTQAAGGGLYAIGSDVASGKIGVFLNQGRIFGRVALINAGVSADSDCYNFVLTRPTERRLVAFCGNELAQLSPAGGYQGIGGTELSYISGIDAASGSGGSTVITAITATISSSSASVRRITLRSGSPPSNKRAFGLPSTKYAGSVLVVK